MEKKMTAKEMSYIGVFVAVMIVMSQIAIPVGSVPITLQTFGIALMSTILGARKAVWVIFVYILLGIIGVPVFANLGAGLGVLLGFTGGFIVGFPIMAWVIGYSSHTKYIITIIMGLLGLLIVHILGVWRFSSLTERSFFQSAMLVSFPYLIKDIISVVAGILLGNKIKHQLKMEGITKNH